jgi:hypothetical protein
MIHFDIFGVVYMVQVGVHPFRFLWSVSTVQVGVSSCSDVHH